LILRDLDLVAKRLERQRHALKVGDKTAKAAKEELAVLESVERALAQGRPVRSLALDAEQRELIRETPILTLKPVLFVANIKDEQITAPDDPHLQALGKLAAAGGAPLVSISARTEAELNDLTPEDRKVFMAELGLADRGLDRFVRAGYQLLDLITFFTTVGVEVRAWTIKRGTPAAKAAGKIHTDFEKGFIRAEVLRAADLIALGSEQAAREKGLLRVEGRDYAVEDGDVIRFRFNV
jgi:hypothetical protein